MRCQNISWRVLTHDYDHSLLSTHCIHCLPHHLEPSEKQEMAGGDSLHHHPHAFSLKVVPVEIGR